MTDTIKQVKVSELVVRSNYRQKYSESTVTGIANKMRKSGFKKRYPITVYRENDKYVIIDGHTRYTAALTLDNPDFLVWVDVDDKPNDEEFYGEQLDANELRADPDPVSQGIGYQRYIDAGGSIEKLMDRLNHNRDYIQRRLDLLTLNADIQALVANGNLPLTFAAEMSRLNTNFQRTAILAYQEMKSPNKETWLAVINGLYTKQSQCSLFDLPMFGGSLVEFIEDVTKSVNKKPSYTALEKQYQAELELRKRIQREATAEILKLRAIVQSINQQKAA